MISANKELRTFLKENDIKHWQLGLLLGISESTVYRLLRNECQPEVKKKIICVVNAYLASKRKE